MASSCSGAQSLILPRNVCARARVCVSTKAHGQQIREEGGAVEWGRLEVINISHASLQSSSYYANVTKSICRQRPWKIILQAQIRAERYSGWLSQKTKKTCNQWHEGEPLMRLWTKRRRVTGWPSKGSEASSSVCGQTTWPQANNSFWRLSVKSQNTVQVLHSKTEPRLKQSRVKAASFCDQKELHHFIWLKGVNMVVINSVMER